MKNLVLLSLAALGGGDGPRNEVQRGLPFGGDGPRYETEESSLDLSVPGPSTGANFSQRCNLRKE
jgi:hypothetical protein